MCFSFRFFFFCCLCRVPHTYLLLDACCLFFLFVFCLAVFLDCHSHWRSFSEANTETGRENMALKWFNKWAFLFTFHRNFSFLLLLLAILSKAIKLNQLCVFTIRWFRLSRTFRFVMESIRPKSVDIILCSSFSFQFICLLNIHLFIYRTYRTNYISKELGFLCVVTCRFFIWYNMNGHIYFRALAVISKWIYQGCCMKISFQHKISLPFNLCSVYTRHNHNRKISNCFRFISVYYFSFSSIWAFVL